MVCRATIAMWSRPTPRAEGTWALCPGRRCQSPTQDVLGAGSSCVMNGAGAWRHLHTQLMPEPLMWDVKQTWGTSCQTRGCLTLQEKRLRNPKKLRREMRKAVWATHGHGATKHEGLLSQAMMMCHHLVTQLYFSVENEVLLWTMTRMTGEMSSEPQLWCLSGRKEKACPDVWQSLTELM